jgi:hypothetical protein
MLIISAPSNKGKMGGKRAQLFCLPLMLSYLLLVELYHC